MAASARTRVSSSSSTMEAALSSAFQAYGQDAQDFLKPDIKLATELLKFNEYIGRDTPDVKT
jgi:hypothetical protein